MKHFFLPVLLSGLYLFTSCSKQAALETEATPTARNNNSPLTNNTPSSNTPTGRLSYGDSLFYNHILPADKLINPVSVPSGTAKFKAIPGGLSIDSVTGRINITKSESGLRYKIFSINNSGIALDSVKLVISGVDYADGIFEIAATPNAYDTSFPIYNARPSLRLPCSQDDDDDENGCVFDETDLNNDGNDDIAGVIQDKLLVDKKEGTIDLEASFHAGIFGSSNPANGSFRNFLMYYRLNDASNRSLQKINIRVYYYNLRSDIPQLLLSELVQRNNQQLTVNARITVSAEFYSYEKPKRPPLLILIGRTQ
jgi:hypothetical protein